MKRLCKRAALQMVLRTHQQEQRGTNKQTNKAIKILHYREVQYVYFTSRFIQERLKLEQLLLIIILYSIDAACAASSLAIG